MSIARVTIGINKWVEGIAAGKPGRRALVVTIITVTGLLIVSAGLMGALGVGTMPVVATAGAAAAIVLLALMILRHDWLFLLAMFLGHTIFYGRPPHLGMRPGDGPGPSDFVFFLCFVGALVYWSQNRDRPKVPIAMLVAPIALFAYTLVYMMIAYVFWARRDVALLQAVGWFYFVLVLPAYLSFATGRIWKGFFILLILTLLAACVLSTFSELRIFESVLIRTGYGGPTMRSWGDIAVKTNALATVMIGMLFCVIIVAFSQKATWRLAATGGFLAGLVVIFLDRGRIHYAGLAIVLFLLMFFLPTLNRMAVIFRLAIALAIVVVAIESTPLRDTFNRALAVAWERIELSQPHLLSIDPGLKDREKHEREAADVFRSNPVFGAGPGTIFHYRVNWENRELEGQPFIDQSWIYPLAVGGVVGLGLILACFASFLGLTIWAIMRLRNPLHRALASVAILQYVFMLVCSTVTFWMVDRFHIAAFSICTAIALALVYHERVHGSDVPVVEF